MKRQTQQAGIRNWYGGDLLGLQEEPLKVLDSFFGNFGNYIVAGCNISSAGTKYDISPGIVVLDGAGEDGQSIRIVAPFAGVAGVSLPIYLSMVQEVEEDQYNDGEVKPISYSYSAVATNVRPSGSHIAIAAADSAPRFVDMIQDAAHRFVADTERTAWNAKETPAGAQGKATAALTSARTYTDTRETALREALNNAFATAKAYAETLDEYVREDIESALERMYGYINGPAGGDLTGNYPNPTIGTGKVGTAKIADLAVTSAKLGNAAVSSAKLGASSVTAEKIATAAVTTDKINASAVTRAKIATTTITESKMAAKSISEPKLTDNLVKTVRHHTTLTLSKKATPIVITSGRDIMEGATRTPTLMDDGRIMWSIPITTTTRSAIASIQITFRYSSGLANVKSTPFWDFISEYAGIRITLPMTVGNSSITQDILDVLVTYKD